MPHTVSDKELGEIEGGLPELKRVHIICHTIEDPAGKLDTAVVGNLKKSIPYTFLISPSKARDEAEGYFQIFTKYAELAAPDVPTEQLVSIRRLDQEWLTFPYIFYTIERGNRKYVISYRGTQKNEGIAERYELMDGHESAAILTEALSNATSLEEELRPRNSSNTNYGESQQRKTEQF